MPTATVADIILLTASAKNGKTYSGEIAIDVSDITCPTPDGGGSPVVVHVRSTDNFQKAQSDNVNADAWTVTESLSAIAAMDYNLAVIPVYKKFSGATKDPVTYSPAKDFMFYLPSIVGPIEADGGGCHFSVREQGNPTLVTYYVAMSVSALVSSLPTGGGGGALTWAQVLANGNPSGGTDPILSNSDKFKSPTVDGTEMLFGATGDLFQVTTDGGKFGEFWIYGYGKNGGPKDGAGIGHKNTYYWSSYTIDSPYSFTTTDITGYHPAWFIAGKQADITSIVGYDPAFSLSEGYAAVRHDIYFWMNTPMVLMTDNGLFDCDTPNGTVSAFTTNASIIQFGKAGANTTMYSTLTMNDAIVQLSAGTTGHASINITAGIAPTLPSDGDIYFDGTDVFIRVSGAWKTFTLV
jgi:hypothetical protein